MDINLDKSDYILLIWVFMGMHLNTDTLHISREILSLIAELDEFKGTWRALGALSPERLSALRHVATIESIGSSTRIEGSKLSDREVDRLLRSTEIKKFETRDEQEVAGYAEVMEAIFAHTDDIDLTENHVKQLHRDLLVYSVNTVTVNPSEFSTSSRNNAPGCIGFCLFTP